MAPGFKSAIRWGCWIGLANLVWLYAAYYLGLHTTTMGAFYGFTIGWFVLNLVAYFVALRALRPSFGSAWSYRTGLIAGIMIAAVTAVIAALAQVGYFTAVNPGWPDFLAEKTAEMAAAEGLAEEEVAEAVESIRAQVTLPNYAPRSAFTALVLGTLLSFIYLVFLRKPAESPEG